MTPVRTASILIVWAAGTVTAGLFGGEAAGQTPPESSVEAAVLNQLRTQPIGRHTVDDLNLPDEFLQQVGDRIIRMSYQERFRAIVVAQAGPTTRDDGRAPVEGPATDDQDDADPTPISTSPRWFLIAGGMAVLGVLIVGSALVRKRRRGR